MLASHLVPLATSTATTTSSPSNIISGIPNVVLLAAIAAVVILGVAWMLTRPRE